MTDGTENSLSFVALGKDRKRKKSYHSDESESVVYEAKRVKRRKQELPPESAKVQMTLAQFVENTGKETTSATVDSGLKLTVDAATEIYQYGHTKKSGSRNTLFVLSDKHQDLSALKKDLRKEYGLTTDARRYQIGHFNIEIGVACSEKAYMANTQTEW